VGDRGVRGAVIDTSLLSSIMHLKREERIDPGLLYAECGVRFDYSVRRGSDLWSFWAREFLWNAWKPWRFGLYECALL